MIVEKIEDFSKFYYNDGKCLIGKRADSLVFMKRIYFDDQLIKNKT